jgi:mono/diheme cytochrome c family protein
MPPDPSMRLLLLAASIFRYFAGPNPEGQPMYRSQHFVALALLFTAAVAAQAQDTGAGHAVADRVCRPCHAVDPGQPKPRLITIGPAFVDIANSTAMTRTALYVLLQTPHGKMPSLILSPQEAADVVAYIHSLRR